MGTNSERIERKSEIVTTYVYMYMEKNPTSYFLFWRYSLYINDTCIHMY